MAKYYGHSFTFCEDLESYFMFFVSALLLLSGDVDSHLIRTDTLVSQVLHPLLQRLPSGHHSGHSLNLEYALLSSSPSFASCSAVTYSEISHHQLPPFVPVSSSMASSFLPINVHPFQNFPVILHLVQAWTNCPFTDYLFL